MVAKASNSTFSNDNIRDVILRYFYTRNQGAATSARSDKSGVAAKISIVRKDLKEKNGLSVQQVWSNLTYLISQGWVAEESVTKTVPLPSGMTIPQSTAYYKITAAGIDKIEGPGSFTMDKFRGIKIQATGQNIITVGDGNQVDAHFSRVGEALAQFKDDVRAATGATERQKLELVADIDSVQNQLAKTKPDKSIVQQLWAAVEVAGTAVGLAANAGKIGQLLHLIP